MTTDTLHITARPPVNMLIAQITQAFQNYGPTNGQESGLEIKETNSGFNVTIQSSTPEEGAIAAQLILAGLNMNAEIPVEGRWTGASFGLSGLKRQAALLVMLGSLPTRAFTTMLLAAALGARSDAIRIELRKLSEQGLVERITPNQGPQRWQGRPGNSASTTAPQPKLKHRVLAYLCSQQHEMPISTVAMALEEPISTIRPVFNGLVKKGFIKGVDHGPHGAVLYIPTAQGRRQFTHPSTSPAPNLCGENHDPTTR